MALIGNINLLKLQGAQYGADASGRECILIPVRDNDIYIRRNDNGEATGANLGLFIGEYSAPSRYGETHFIKQSVSKHFRGSLDNAQLSEEISRTYLGNLRPQSVAQPQPLGFSSSAVACEPAPSAPFAGSPSATYAAMLGGGELVPPYPPTTEESF